MKRKERLQYQVLSALLVGVVSVSTWGGQYGIAQAAEGEETSTDKQTVAMADYGDEDVVVTAAAMPTKIAATPANVTVITAQEIEDNHYKTVGEALEQVNGVTITKMGGGNVEYVRLNGDDRVVLLLDGQKLNTEQGSIAGRYSADLAMIPLLNNIERIEVIKGGASALYGSEAVGGVINIITKKATKNQSEIGLAYGSQGAHNYTVKTQGTQGDFSWQIAAGLEGNNDFDYKFAGKSYTMKNSDSKKHDFFLRLDQKFTDRDSLQFNYMHKSVYGALYKCFGSTSVPYTDYSGYYHNLQEVFNNTSLTYKFKEGTAAPGFVRYFYNNRNMSYENQYDTHTQGIDYQNGWQLDKDNVLIAGAELHWSKSSNSPNGYDGSNIDTQAFYLQDTVTAGKWTLIPGVRMDHHSKFGSHWSPKLAVNYQADANNQIYANYNRVFKAPTADDLYWHNPGQGSVGNPELQPESGWTTSVGYKHNFNAESSADISYFSSEISDAIAWDYIHYYPMKPVNVNREKKQGIELNYTQKINDNWEYSLGYTHVNIKVDGEVSKTNMMPNGYKIGLNFKNKDFRASLQGKIGGGLDEGRYVNRGYNLWNLNLNYDFNANVTGYIQALNLTNSEHYTYATSYGQYYPAAGRTFMVGVNVKF